ncbi:MAG: LemA family protein [Eubacteriaceae bacterium]|jgi:LemA protein|nr:LemA family protein [Eubacteriaceae bacterium]
MSNIFLPILGVVLLLAVGIIVIFNRLIRLKNQVDEAYSGMDVQMKMRYDLIPNLVETVKGYASHESETLEAVISARNIASHTQNVEEALAAEGQLTRALRSLFAVAENYPDLKANANFMDLQNRLQKIESDIAKSRLYYNGTVKQFNNVVAVFPNNLIAGILGFTKQPFYTLDSEDERSVPEVRF